MKQWKRGAGNLLLAVLLAAGCSSGENAMGGGATVQTTGGTGASGTADVTTPVAVPVCETSVPIGGFHVAVDGLASGNGTLQSPWDLQTALIDPPGVGPGDTIWVHGGRYAGAFVVKLDGAEGAPITVRAWPTERVILDGAGVTEEPVVQIYRAWTVLRDLEISNSDEDRTDSRSTGIYLGGDHVSLINLVVHDVGVGVSGGQMRDDGTQEGTNLELYGNIFYNNGYRLEDRGHGHHSYLTNRTSVLRFEENILFHAYGFGVHHYSSNDTKSVKDMELVGNVWFQNGIPGGETTDGCMLGHDGTEAVSGIVLRENFGWASLTGRDLRLGWATANEDAVLQDNYLVGQTVFQNAWQSLELTGNTFVGSVEGVEPADHADNQYLASAPLKNHIVVRPNRHEPGRAHIIVYNWEGSETVSVDLGGFLPSGTKYVVRNVQDFFGAGSLSGVYEGGPLRLPLEGLTVAQPIGDPTAIPEDQRTGSAFNVFVLQAAVCEE